MSKMKTSSLLLAGCLFVFSGSSNAEISPIENFQWDYLSICDTTIPSYVKSFSDGEKELILLSLEYSDSFSSLGEDQRQSFLNLVEHFHRRHSKEGVPLQEVKEECSGALEEAINSVSLYKHRFCQDVADRVAQSASQKGKESLAKRGIKEIKSVSYRMCMTEKVNEK